LPRGPEAGIMTWTAPEITRPCPPEAAGERATLEGYLEFHRATLLWKCAGLDGEQLARRSVPPSSLSLLGLVRHLAEAERAWFRREFRGERLEQPVRARRPSGRGVRGGRRGRGRGGLRAADRGVGPGPAGGGRGGAG
jgi:hypothetical protein